MKYAGLGALGAALVGLIVLSLVLSSFFCAIPWSMVSKG